MSRPKTTTAAAAYPTKPKLKPTTKPSYQTAESRLLSSFKPNTITPSPFPSSVPSIAFSPSSPHPFAAAHSASLSLYSPDTLSPTHTIRLPDVVCSLSFRIDGSLLAASDLSGTIRVFDVKSRAPLRHLKSHSRPVRLVQYPAVADKSHLVSGGDDGLVKYWDVLGESVVREFKGHKDYVRSGDCSPVDAECFITGSYDHVVKLWDVRRSGDGSSAMEINHGKPVEDVVYLPSGSLIATAGGNCVKVWDLIGGGRMLWEMESHNKTVTSLCVGRVGKASDGIGDEGMEYRVLSVGLDGYLKVFDYSRMKVTYSRRFPAALLSVGVSADSQVLAIGTSNGNIFAGRRKKKNKEESDVVGKGGVLGFGDATETRRKVPWPGSYRYFHRGQSEKPSEEDYLVAKPKKVKLAEHDKLLKKFRHKEALVSVLRSNAAEKVVAVMEELVARKKLLKCVTNLDIEELDLLLKFLHKNSTLPRYAGLLMLFTKKVVDARVEDISSSDVLKGHIRNLRRAVEEEIRIQQELQEIQGVISPLLRIAGRR